MLLNDSLPRLPDCNNLAEFWLWCETLYLPDALVCFALDLASDHPHLTYLKQQRSVYMCTIRTEEIIFTKRSWKKRRVYVVIIIEELNRSTGYTQTQQKIKYEQDLRSNFLQQNLYREFWECTFMMKRRVWERNVIPLNGVDSSTRLWRYNI